MGVAPKSPAEPVVRCKGYNRVMYIKGRARVIFIKGRRRSGSPQGAEAWGQARAWVWDMVTASGPTVSPPNRESSPRKATRKESHTSA